MTCLYIQITEEEVIYDVPELPVLQQRSKHLICVLGFLPLNPLSGYVDQSLYIDMYHSSQTLDHTELSVCYIFRTLKLYIP